MKKNQEFSIIWNGNFRDYLCLLLFIIIICLMVCNSAYAKSGLSFGYGYQTYMYGYSIGIQQSSGLYCPNDCNQGFSFPVSGYWDLQAYDFRSRNNGPIVNLIGGSFAHMFRLQRCYVTCSTVPYAELGFGLAYFNRKTIPTNQIGSPVKDLGTQLPILLKFGLGFNFGEKLEYDISYKFVNFWGFAGKRNNSINANFIVLNFWF